jgi:hypothetical protein
MSGFLRVQLNLVNENLDFNNDIKAFSHLSVPILWIEFVSFAEFSLSFEFKLTEIFLQAVDGLPIHLRLLVKLASDVLPFVQIVVAVAFLVIGTFLIMWACFLPIMKERHFVDIETIGDKCKAEDPLLIERKKDELKS